MTKITYSIAAIDISAAALDIAALSEDGAFVSTSVANDEAGGRALVRWFKRHGAGLIVLEATGELERPIPRVWPSASPRTGMARLEAAGLAVARINPRQVTKRLVFGRPGIILQCQSFSPASSKRSETFPWVFRATRSVFKAVLRSSIWRAVTQIVACAFGGAER